MRVSRAKAGPFAQQLYYGVDEIDDICLAALESSGCLPNGPCEIDVERFVEKHFRCDIGYEELPSNVMGFAAFDAHGTVVQVRVAKHLEDGSKAGERRVRTTWAHEAGHGLLHSRLFQSHNGGDLIREIPGSNVGKDRFLCRAGDVKPVGVTYDGRWWEWQANRAIGGLLLPRDLVRTSVKEFIVESVVARCPRLPEKSRTPAAEVVSKTFNVNPIVAKIRLFELYPQQNNAQMEF